MKSQDNSEVLLRGTLGSDGLYSFRSLLRNNGSSHVTRDASFPLVHCTSVNSLRTHNKDFLLSSSSSYTIWHCRLGHPHFEALKTALNHCKISLPDKMSSDFCSACCLGKHIVFLHTLLLLLILNLMNYCSAVCVDLLQCSHPLVITTY